MKLNNLRLAAAAALCGAALSAQAIDVRLNFANGSANGMTVGVTNQGSSVGPVSVGAFAGQSGASSPYNTASFVTYCVELTESFGTGALMTGYNLTGGSSYFNSFSPSLALGANQGATVAARLSRLFSSLGGVTTPASTDLSAGIQLAVWESIYEGTNYGNVSSGMGVFTASGSSTAITAANSVLSGALAYVGPNLFSVGVLTKTGSQDFLVLERGSGPQGIPEPGTIVLSMAALGALAFAKRRRSASTKA